MNEVCDTDLWLADVPDEDSYPFSRPADCLKIMVNRIVHTLTILRQVLMGFHHATDVMLGLAGCLDAVTKRAEDHTRYGALNPFRTAWCLNASSPSSS